MYSFNLDYIFNLVYNCFLAIRYILLFWILRITPEEYLLDHQYDKWDGLRDRGWLTTSTSSLSQNTDNIVYLGQVANEHNSKITDTIQQVNHQPWFESLHFFSIQNPILAFLADVLSVFSFFIILLLIYITLKWFAIILSPINEEKDKQRITKMQEVLAKKEEQKVFKTKKIEAKEKETTEPEEKLIQVKREIKKEHTDSDHYHENEDILNLENTLPAGIANLPIDESDLSSRDRENLTEKQDLLLSYKIKNILPVKENKILKVKSSNLENSENPPVKKIEAMAISLQDIEKKERQTWYQERWEIILGYMEGTEDALWRIGILEADNLLDAVLVEKGYIGSTLSDKLSQATFKSIDLAWSAHKIRNRIAHDGMQFALTERLAKKTIEEFRAVFTELKVLE